LFLTFPTAELTFQVFISSAGKGLSRSTGSRDGSAGASGATPLPKVVAQINASLAGWVNYFRVGNASGAFSEVRDYTEMKVRTRNGRLRGEE
jgi:hypothetical protein